MPAVILDACGMLNLYSSGRFVPILSTLRLDWFLPAAVEREAHKYRQPDPADPQKLIAVPIDLTEAITGGVLKRCDCETEDEIALYTELAGQIGDDGESMGLAIAKLRGWSVLTDDKKARRIATELCVPVLSTPEIMKQWAEIVDPTPSELSFVLQSIERFSNYIPNRTATEYAWWIAAIRSE